MLRKNKQHHFCNAPGERIFGSILPLRCACVWTAAAEKEPIKLAAHSPEHLCEHGFCKRDFSTVFTVIGYLSLSSDMGVFFYLFIVTCSHKCYHSYLLVFCFVCFFLGGEVEADRTHIKWKANTTGRVLPFPRQIGIRFQGIYRSNQL